MTPKKEVLHIEGNDFFEFNDWCDPSESPANWLDSFFTWKRIHNPEQYFRYGFSRIALPTSEFYFREANAQGVRAQDFAKVIATVAHFVERAASGYPPKVRPEREPEGILGRNTFGTLKQFRPVPFGEIFSVLGTNTHETPFAPLLQGSARADPPVVLEDGQYQRTSEGGQYILPTSDFRTHSRFLILALSLLVELGVLHLEVKSYPSDITSVEEDSDVPYDRRVHWLQALIYRYNTDFTQYTYCFAPHKEYSDVAWKALINTLRFQADCLGLSAFDSTCFEGQDSADYIERNFDYATENYWCPVVCRYTDFYL